jgi:hypothetical protein
MDSLLSCMHQSNFQKKKDLLQKSPGAVSAMKYPFTWTKGGWTAWRGPEFGTQQCHSIKIIGSTKTLGFTVLTETLHIMRDSVTHSSAK